jgi:hypothetical protein
VPTDSAIGGGSNGLVLAWPASDAVGQASAANAGSFPVADFFWPVLSPVGYAFLGAYVFTLFHVLRGYQRRDLHAKTYNTVVVRILSAYVLALVVTVVYTGEYAGVFLFFVGFTPQSALVWLRERLSDYRGRLHAFPLKEPSPLTDLEGIDLYDRTRLAEEGINNVEALAHADIVELMSSTRISAAQLVDWTDQAILYLRVGGDSSAKNRDLCSRGSDGAPADDSPAAPAITDGEDPGGPPSGAVHCVPDVRVNLCHLRSYGIRTATDLLEVYHQALRRGCDNPDRRAAEVNALRTALELPNGPRDRQVRTIQTIIDTLPDEEWFVQVRNWRRPEFGSFDSWYRYLDGTGWQLRDKLPLPARVTEAMQQLEPIPMASVAAGVPPCGAAEAQPTGAEASDAVPALTTSTEHVEEPGPDVAEPTPIMDAVLTL